MEDRNVYIDIENLDNEIFEYFEKMKGGFVKYICNIFDGTNSLSPFIIVYLTIINDFTIFGKAKIEIKKYTFKIECNQEESIIDALLLLDNSRHGRTYNSVKLIENSQGITIKELLEKIEEAISENWTH